ncbi:hypothetical protein [Actinomadura sp. SCN-SB]|uniref:hypothetical protein n=1 Tax=Actinomadura sp. SCN-SB TaxID=3373092 RepID=UPI003752C21C
MTEHATNRPRGAEEQDDPAMSTADLGARLGMTAILRAEAERLIAQPPAPSPTPTPDTEPLIDPDCRDGKCGSCVGGPCEHECHQEATSHG